MLHFGEHVQVMARATTARLTSKQTGSIPMSSVFLCNVHISLTLCYNVPKICLVLHHLFLSKRQYLHFNICLFTSIISIIYSKSEQIRHTSIWIEACGITSSSLHTFIHSYIHNNNLNKLLHLVI